MDPVGNAMLNAGAFGILAGVLYILHSNALKNFRVDQQEARASHKVALDSLLDHNMNLWKTTLDLKLKHHEEIMTELRGIKCKAEFVQEKRRTRE